VIFNWSVVITITRRETKGLWLPKKLLFACDYRPTSQKYIKDLLTVQGLKHNYSAARLSGLIPVLMSPGESFWDMYA